MSNRKIHTIVGATSGGVFAGAVAGNRGSNVLLEGIGGGLGGWVGARLPDLIDPPTSPRHRSVGHGVAQSAIAGRYLLDAIPRWQGWLRGMAAQHQEAARIAPDRWSELGHTIAHVVLLLASGAILELVVGYLSHLILDGTTAAGLPFVA
jgi:hypothetical protein